MILFVLFLAYIMLIFLMPGYAFLCASLIINFFIMVIYKINLKKVMSNLFGISIFVFLTFFINLIAINFLEAANISVRLLLVCNATYIFSKIMPPLKIVEVVERLLKPMKLINISSKDIGVLICIAISFIPIFKSEMRAILTSIKAKGVKVNIKNFHLILSPILVSSLKKTGDIELSLKAKGYK